MANSQEFANTIKKKSLYQRKPCKQQKIKLKLTSGKKRRFSDLNEIHKKNEPSNKRLKRNINGGKQEEDEEGKDSGDTKDKKAHSPKHRKNSAQHRIKTTLQNHFEYTRALEAEVKKLRDNALKLRSENQLLRKEGKRVVEERDELIANITKRLRGFTDLVNATDDGNKNKKRDNDTMDGTEAKEENVMINDDTAGTVDNEISESMNVCAENRPLQRKKRKEKKTVKEEEGTTVPKTVLVRDGLELLGYKIDNEGVLDLISSDESENENS